MSKYPVYLAGPFFTNSQVKVIEKLESKISNSGLDLISPRKSEESVQLASMLLGKEEYPQEEMEKKCFEVFRRNCIDIERSKAVIAFIDGFDSGTIYELGYAFRQGELQGQPQWIISFSDNDYGVENLMIGCSVDCHCRSDETLDKVLDLLKSNSKGNVINPKEFEKASDSLGTMV
jgi:hypothetical protein